MYVTEPDGKEKPGKIFLQDGTNDLNIYAGDWWKANETMERAFTFAGYEVTMFGAKASTTASRAPPSFHRLCAGYGKTGLSRLKHPLQKTSF